MSRLTIGVDATALVKRPTGIGHYVVRLLKPLVECHPEADFILFSNEEVCFPTYPNVRTRTSYPKRRGLFWQNTHLREMLVNECPDVFWATNGLLPIFGRNGIPVVLTVHDLVYKFAPQTLPFLSRWSRRVGQHCAVALADKVVCVSKATAFDALSQYGRNADAIVPPLVGETFLRPSIPEIDDLRARLGLPEGYLLTLGTVEPRKNLASLLRAYLNRREAGVKLPLLAIAGGKGWLDKDVTALIKHCENLGYVRRLGYVDFSDLPALYAGCEAFLMPSLYEGFGMPLLEAQMCGAPVVHGTHASMREAAGGLGVVTATDVSSIERTFEEFAKGALPLACRLRTDIVNDAVLAAEEFWKILTSCSNIRSPKHS